ncbi:toxin VasX [Marinobacter sp. CHS3-4]|uniref:toxin VasX n=1 Tax=Marinobacter sp. CHS3-4 TaxID=3045174 RepID=UPI0024B48C56|nr:toxin VasX [Marinobacter sp. CHS3-4]MDI9244424.1 hypothetical protein [Marinobacter sp. CHS3-4]
MTGACISTGSPCREPEKLYVEVAGTDVHEGHGLLLEKSGEPVAEFAMTQRQWHQRYECDYAVGAADRFDHTLSLTVDKEQGGKLRLPLLDEPHPTRLSARTQPNLLFPIYPLAEMPWVEGETGHALLRPGYLYVFWKGILWRELQTNENGKLRDIDLADCRQRAKAEGPGVLDVRETSGVELETLWVPARFQTVGRARWTIGEVELAWSEQQWSWEYIESLESGLGIINLPAAYRELTGIPVYGKRGANDIDARRKARCKSLKTLESYQYGDRFGPDKLASYDWVLLNEAAACPVRNPDREKEALNPALVAQSLNGGGLEAENTVLHNIREELERMEGFTCKAPETMEFAKGMNRWVEDMLGEEWRTLSGKSKSIPDSQEATDQSEAARKDLLNEVRRRLENAATGEDQLALLKERHIPGVPVPDVLFELEWLTHQTSLHLTYLSSLAESAQQHPHFKSAMLVHSSVLDYRGSRRGPYRDYQHLVDLNKLDQALRKEDREACRSMCYELNRRRINLLEGDAVRVFNDLFALNGLFYPIALQTLNPLLSHLETSVFQFDPLAGRVAKETEAYLDSAGARYIQTLAKGQAGLSAFLTAPTESNAEAAGEPEPNDGSGRPRPGLMGWLQGQRPAADDLPESIREHYQLSEQERGRVLESVQKMADSELLQWVAKSYTTMGQLMADVSSEFYLVTQRALLRKISDGPIYQVKDTLQIPTRYMKLGNPFFRDLVLGHADLSMANPNPDMVPLGIKFGTQGAGISALPDDKLDDALRKPNGVEVLRPKGGVVNRVGPGMNGNYAVIRNGNGRLLASATSVAGLQGLTPANTVEVEMFLAPKDSVAAKMSKGFQTRAGNALMRWAPPGMLGVFGFNIAISSQSILNSNLEKGIPLKELTIGVYGIANLMYWLGHIVEAENISKSTRLSWLTAPRLDVDRMDNAFGKSVAKRLFSDRVLSYAKFAGAFGAVLEVFLSLWEGVERLQANDTDAAAGYFTAAGGFLVFMFSHWAGSAIIPVLGITLSAAVAAVALVVALAGLLWGIFNTDDTLEIWLKHGPFGKSEAASQFQHLHDSPDDAFQFLISAFFPLNGIDGSLAWFNDRSLLSGEEQLWLFENKRTEGHVIAVSTAAFSLMDRPEDQFKAHFWMETGYGDKAKPIAPSFVHYDAERHMVRFHLPKPQWRRAGRSRLLEKLRGKIQIAMPNGSLLPASDIENPLSEPAINPGFSGTSSRWHTIAG